MIPRGPSKGTINCLLPAGGEALWIGTDTGVMHWDGATVTKAGVAAQLTSSPVLAMTKDHKSNLWVANTSGLWFVDGKGNAALEQPATADSAPTTSLLEDREGNIWTGNAAGIERLRPTAFLTYATSGSPRPENDGALYADAGNRIWFAPTDGGLDYVREGKIVRISVEGLDKDVIYSIIGDGNELWLGRQHGGLTRLGTADGAFTSDTYTAAQGLAQNSVFTVYRSRDGTVADIERRRQQVAKRSSHHLHYRERARLKQHQRDP